ncbi:MAG: Protease HtpX [Verrucomicrobiota bacterium]|jgi:heat shock protein HtpX
MAFIFRLILFLLVNAVILFTISLLFWATGLDQSLGHGVWALLVFCLFWGMGGSLLSLMMSRSNAKRLYRIEPIQPQTSDPTERALIGRVHNLARRAGMSSMPEVGIFHSPELNAFATGSSRDSALVAVSSGLLENMNAEEVDGVLGHELAHVNNGDMVTLTLIQGVVNAFVMFFARLLAAVIDSALRSRGRRDQGGRSWVYSLVVMMLEFVFGLLGMMLVTWFSRWREFRADAGGAEYAGKEKMIAALRRLQQNRDIRDPRRDPKLNAFMISGFGALLSTHPPLEARIARLEARD